MVAPHPAGQALRRLKQGRVRLDALPTQSETARQLLLAHGADYLLSAKNHQPG